MEEMAILYVKSEKIPIVKHSVGIHGHPCTAADRAVQTHTLLTPEDQEAKELVEKSGVSFKIIDLGECSFLTQIKAKISGINKTPTLILNGKAIRGIQNIRKALQDFQLKRGS